MSGAALLGMDDRPDSGLEVAEGPSQLPTAGSS